MNKNTIFRINTWLLEVYDTLLREARLIFRDEGVIIFIFVLCALYPVLYALIYNPEVVRDERVVVVDNDRSNLSREWTRALDATQEIKVIGYAANMNEARQLMANHECYGIVEFPRDFAATSERGEQAHMSLYCDMGVVMRYKAMFTALSNVSQAMSTSKQAAIVAPVLYQKGAIVNNRQVPVGNTQTGIASAVLIFILPMVLQQSMILAVAMLHGGSIERRRRNRGYDPTIEYHTCVSATIVGRTVCHLVMYIVPTLYVLLLLPLVFSFPHNADPIEVCILAAPFLIASSLMAQVLQVYTNERETVFILFVFSSVVFVMLSGVSWPRYEMSRWWRAVGDCVPSTWMCNAYVLMQSDGASLRQVALPYSVLCGMCLIFYFLAYAVERWVSRRRYRAWQEAAATDPDALHHYDHIKNGVD